MLRSRGARAGFLHRDVSSVCQAPARAAANAVDHGSGRVAEELGRRHDHLYARADRALAAVTLRLLRFIRRRLAPRPPPMARRRTAPPDLLRAAEPRTPTCERDGGGSSRAKLGRGFAGHAREGGRAEAVSPRIRSKRPDLQRERSRQERMIGETSASQGDQRFEPRSDGSNSWSPTSGPGSHTCGRSRSHRPLPLFATFRSREVAESGNTRRRRGQASRCIQPWWSSRAAVLDVGELLAQLHRQLAGRRRRASRRSKSRGLQLADRRDDRGGAAGEDLGDRRRTATPSRHSSIDTRRSSTAWPRSRASCEIESSG